MPLPVHPDVEGLGERGRPPVHDKVPNALASPRVRLQVRQHPRLRHHDVQLVALAQRLRRRLDARPRLPVQRAVRLGGADLRGRVRTRLHDASLPLFLRTLPHASVLEHYGELD